MENIVCVKFENQSKAYEVLSDLKTQQNSFNIPSAGIVVKDDGKLSVKDYFNFGDDYDHWAVGGILGSFIGIFGGPLGVMFGASLGTLLGSASDVDEALHQSDIFTEVASSINENDLFLMVLIKEDDRDLFDTYLKGQEASKIYRESIESVEHKLMVSAEIEREVKEKAKEEAKKQKKIDRKEQLDKNIEKIKHTFSKSETN